MFSQSDLDRLLAAMRANGVTRLDLRSGRRRFRLDLPATAAAARPAPQAPAPRSLAVKSPGIGRFLPRGEDDGLPALEPGAAVTEGDVLAYVRQGAVRLVVSAPASGHLRDELPQDGAVLGYGDTLFTMEPEQ